MEILAERAIHPMNLEGIGAMVFCCLAIGVATYWYYNEESFSEEIGKIVIVVSFCLATVFFMLGAKHAITHPVMEYKVRFTEKIDMEEFLDTYRIVDKDGSIITIRCLEPSAPSEEATN